MRIEHWWFTAPLRLRSILRRHRLERELDEELQFHLEHKIEEGLAQGLSPRESRYAALHAMDGLEQKKEEIRDMRGIHWLTDFLDDTRYSIRSLRRTPGLAAGVVVTLALGIGINCAVYSIVDAMMFRPMPVPQASGVITLVSTSRENSYDHFSYREYLDIRDQTKSYAGVIASSAMEAVGFGVRRGATPRVKGCILVSGNYFRVLGVEPRMGRGFRADEDQVPGRDAVVVLGPDFWKDEFAGDPSVLGRHILLNGKEFTIIGVAPAAFTGMQIFEHPDFYVPLAMAKLFSTDSQKNFLEDRDDRELRVNARLKAGVTLEEARSELTVSARNFERAYPQLNHDRGAAVHTQFEMRTQENDVNWKFAVIFGTLAIAVLLVACTNVAGLLLSRARTRTREIALRLAIGAGRFRVVRLLLTESLLLALAGGLAGVALAYAVVGWFHTYQGMIFMTDLPFKMPFQMDTRVLLASLAMALFSALLCGLAPALQSTRTDLVDGLKTADADLPGRRRLWGRNVLVVVQVAASLMLLTTAFTMVRGFQQAVNLTTGFATDHLLMTSFDPRLMQYNPAQTERFYKVLAERIRLVPGVRAEALMESVPLGYGFGGIAFVPDGFDMPRDRRSFSAPMDTIDSGYFETLGIDILNGRGFRLSDTAQTQPVAVVNEQFAKHYWPHSTAVGKHIRLGSRDGVPVEIVGVARTIKYQSTESRPLDFVYLPLTQHPVARMVLMLRSSGDPLQLIPAVKQLVRSIDPNLPMMETREYHEFFWNTVVGGPRLACNMVAAMGATGLLLAIAGLYGVVAYNVNRRTREIGIRMALGAGKSSVLSLVMRQGLVLVALGTLIGLALGVAVEKLMDSMLFDGDGLNVLAYLIVVPSLLVVTMLAAFIPARRATRIAPTQALRCE